MAGESILVIDDSLAVQDIVRSALHDVGYHVTTVSNGTAALTCPSLEDVSLVVIDEKLDGLAANETVRILKQNGTTHPIPVLLMVPDDELTRSESVGLGGACAFLV
ncbi:response regulator, partial [bacterium]|nr:response regulator [bacterium]